MGQKHLRHRSSKRRERFAPQANQLALAHRSATLQRIHLLRARLQSQLRSTQRNRACGDQRHLPIAGKHSLALPSDLLGHLAVDFPILVGQDGGPDLDHRAANALEKLQPIHSRTSITPRCTLSPMLEVKRISVIGAGSMAEALVKGLVASGKVKPEDLCVSARRPEKAAQLAQRYRIRSADDNASCVQAAEIVILAIKPQVLGSVLAQDAARIPASALIISVAAGVTTTAIESHLGRAARIIRAMPNTAAMVGCSATAISKGAHATDADLAVARTIFEAVGKVVVVDEIHLDAVTGLSGSGPAYIFLIIEALADAGVKVGLSREVALQLAAQTLLGSATMLLETGEHPGRLKDQITSPGGTAIAGLHTLEAGGLRTTLMNAVEVATRRAQELGQGSTAPERAKGEKAVES